MLNDYLIEDKRDINFALKKINLNKFKTLLVTNKFKHLLGVVTEGDIRRGILKYSELKTKIEKIYNKKIIVFDNINDVQKKDKIFIKKDIDLIPYVEKKKVTKIYFNYKNPINKNINTSKLRKLSSIIIAGGLGTRLSPFNKVFPKPLMPYKNNSLLLEIIKKFESFSISDFTLVTNHKSAEIKKYVSTIQSKSKIKIIKEKSKLGTVGGLSYLKKKKISDNFFVINCDTILNVDFKKIYEFHLKNKSQLTIVASNKHLKLPFGNCVVDNNLNLTGIIEKPTLEFLANTGCYVFSKKILEYIKKDKFLDFNDLAKILLKKKINICVYRIHHSKWSDFGTVESFKL